MIERVRNAGRMNQILRVAIRFGFEHVIEQAGHVGLRLVRRFRRAGQQPDPTLQRLTVAERLRRMLEELGPVFVKAGQLLSTRPDLVPDWMIAELRKLRDEVPPMPFEDVRAVIEEEFGVPLESRFAEFSPTAVASASVGQVHRAVLPDGQVVAVKVQRRGIGPLIERDLSILSDLATTFQERLERVRHLNLPALAEDFAQALRDELVYTVEGRNSERAAKGLDPANRIRVPKVYWDLTTARVLTTELFDGRPLSEPDQPPEAYRSDIARRLANAILHQILVEGFFHADPHAGNLLCFPDGSLGLLDWGQVGILTRSLRESLGEIFIATVTQDVERLTDEICHLGLVNDDAQIERFRHDLGRALDRYFFLPRRDFPLSEVLHRILELSYEHRVQLPSELPLLIKVLVTTEGTCLELDPAFDLRAAFQPVVKELVGARLEPGKLAQDLGSGLRQLNRLLSETPRQVATILGRIESGSLRLRVEDAQVESAAQALARAANRLTAAVLVTAGLIGGALMYPVQPHTGLAAFAAGLVGMIVVVAALWRGRRA